MDEQAAPKRQRGPNGKFLPGNSTGPRFPPGTSGHPGQKPSIVRALKSLLAEKPELQRELAQACIAHALAGNQAYFKFAIEYLDGKVPDVLRVDTNVFNVNQPGVATGKYELADDDADDQSAGTDP